MSKYPNPVSYAGRKGTSEHSGIVKFGTDAEIQAGISDDLVISPSGLQAIIDTDNTLAADSNTLVASQKATKFYIDNIAVAGAPAASETVAGIAELATQAEVATGTDDLRIVTPLKLATSLASPPAIGGTSAAAGAFTTLAASGLSSLSGSATILTAGTALNLGSDASADAINIVLVQQHE